MTEDEQLDAMAEWWAQWSTWERIGLTAIAVGIIFIIGAGAALLKLGTELQ